jgi:hypothetical protein
MVNFNSCKLASSDYFTKRLHYVPENRHFSLPQARSFAEKFGDEIFLV